MDEKARVVALLEKYGIPLKDWGKLSTKSVNQLIAETAAGESVLTEEDNQLYRDVCVVDGVVYYRSPGKILRLIEKKIVYPDGKSRTRHLSCSLSEKMKAGENSLQALVRGIKEEIGISGDLRFGKERISQYTRASNSYPGLTSRYNISSYAVLIPDEAYRPEGYIEEQKDKTTYFVWEEAPDVK